MIKNMWIKSLIGTVAAVALMSGCGSSDDSPAAGLKIDTNLTSAKGDGNISSVSFLSRHFSAALDRNKTPSVTVITSKGLNVRSYAVIIEEINATHPEKSISHWSAFFNGDGETDGNFTLSHVAVNRFAEGNVTFVNAAPGVDGISQAVLPGTASAIQSKGYVGLTVADANKSFQIKVYALNFRFKPEHKAYLERAAGGTLAGKADGNATWNTYRFEKEFVVSDPIVRTGDHNLTANPKTDKIVASGSEPFQFK